MEIGSEVNLVGPVGNEASPILASGVGNRLVAYSEVMVKERDFREANDHDLGWSVV